jgi:hypothetical protein
MSERPAENYGLDGLPTEVEYLRADRKWLVERLRELEALLVRVREPWKEDEREHPEEFRAKADKLGADIDAALASQTETKGDAT